MALTRITSDGITDAAIVNADINASAAIAGTKISPNFGSQNILTTGKLGVGTTSLNSVFPVTIQAQYPGIQFLDAQGTDSFGINADGGVLKLQVGVGGSGPTQVLQIATASTTITNNLNASAGIDVTGAITGTSAITLGNGSGVNWGDTSARIIGESGGSGLLRFDTDGGEKIRIDSSGRLNIGTDLSDSTMSSVAGLVNIHTTNTGTHNGLTLFWDHNNLTTNIEQRIQFSLGDNASDDQYVNAGYIAIGKADTWQGNSLRSSYLSFATSNAATQAEHMRIHSSGIVTVGDSNGSAYGGQMVVSTATGGVLTCADTGSGERLRLEGGSGIGRIGTDSNHVLVFITNGTSNERMRIDSSGHMGLGVTPNTNLPSNADFKFLQVGTGASLFGRGSGDEDRGGIAVNYYHTGTAEKYLGNGNSSGIILGDGDIDFFTAGANSSGSDAAMSKTIAMRIASTSGKVGIGTLDPQRQLHIVGNDGATGATLGNSDTCLVLDNQGTNGAIIEFLSANNGAARIMFTDTDASNQGQIVYQHSDDSMYFVSNVAERMRIDSSGNLLIGRTSVGNTGNGHSIRGGDSAIFSRNATGETVQICRNSNNGDFVQFRAADSGNASSIGEISKSGGNVVYGGTSDYRLKENRAAISDGITRIKLLKPIRFNFKSYPDETVDGFFAHEVTPAVPEAVIGEKDDSSRMQSLDQSKLVPLLVAALQEAIGRIEALEAS